MGFFLKTQSNNDATMLAASQLHGMADDGNPGTGAVTAPQLAMDFVLRDRHDPLMGKAVASEAAARGSTRIAVPAVQKSACRISTVRFGANLQQ